MTTLVIGANGNVSPPVVGAPAEGGVAPRAIARNPGRAATVRGAEDDLVAGDFPDPESSARRARGWSARRPR